MSKGVELARDALRHPMACPGSMAYTRLKHCIAGLESIQQKDVGIDTSTMDRWSWFAVRLSAASDHDGSSQWLIYRADPECSTDEFIDEAVTSFPHHRMLAPGHPLPRPNASDDTQRIVTLLPAAQVMQVFVCHPMASQDRDRQQFFFTAILEDADVSEDQPVGGREERSQSFHKRLKHSAFGMSPDEWHNFDSRIQGQLARVFISVDTTGDILGGATRQI